MTLLKFHTNGDLLVSASDTPDHGLVNIWSLAIRTVIQTIKFDSHEGPAKTLTWLGHRRLTIANQHSKDLTVILMPTNYDQEFNMDNVKIAATCRKASMGKAEDLMSKTVCLR